MLSKPVVMRYKGYYFINKSYHEALVIEWKEISQILQLKTLGGATKIVSKAAN